MGHLAHLKLPLLWFLLWGEIFKTGVKIYFLIQINVNEGGGDFGILRLQ